MTTTIPIYKTNVIYKVDTRPRPDLCEVGAIFDLPNKQRWTTIRLSNGNIGYLELAPSGWTSGDLWLRPGELSDVATVKFSEVTNWNARNSAIHPGLFVHYWVLRNFAGISWLTATITAGIFLTLDSSRIQLGLLRQAGGIVTDWFPQIKGDTVYLYAHNEDSATASSQFFYRISFTHEIYIDSLTLEINSDEYSFGDGGVTGLIIETFLSPDFEDENQEITHSFVEDDNAFAITSEPGRLSVEDTLRGDFAISFNTPIIGFRVRFAAPPDSNFSTISLKGFQFRVQGDGSVVEVFWENDYPKGRVLGSDEVVDLYFQNKDEEWRLLQRQGRTVYGTAVDPTTLEDETRGFLPGSSRWIKNNGIVWNYGDKEWILLSTASTRSLFDDSILTTYSNQANPQSASGLYHRLDGNRRLQIESDRTLLASYRKEGDNPAEITSLTLLPSRAVLRLESRPESGDYLSSVSSMGDLEWRRIVTPVALTLAMPWSTSLLPDEVKSRQEFIDAQDNPTANVYLNERYLINSPDGYRLTRVQIRFGRPKDQARLVETAPSTVQFVRTTNEDNLASVSLLLPSRALVPLQSRVVAVKQPQLVTYNDPDLTSRRLEYSRTYYVDLRGTTETNRLTLQLPGAESTAEVMEIFIRDLPQETFNTGYLRVEALPNNATPIQILTPEGLTDTSEAGVSAFSLRGSEIYLARTAGSDRWLMSLRLPEAGSEIWTGKLANPPNPALHRIWIPQDADPGVMKFFSPATQTWEDVV